MNILLLIKKIIYSKEFHIFKEPLFIIIWDTKEYPSCPKESISRFPLKCDTRYNGIYCSKIYTQ